MLEIINNKLFISSKFVFDFYQRTGVPPEILEDWFNKYWRKQTKEERIQLILRSLHGNL